QPMLPRGALIHERDRLLHIRSGEPPRAIESEVHRPRARSWLGGSREAERIAATTPMGDTGSLHRYGINETPARRPPRVAGHPRRSQANTPALALSVSPGIGTPQCSSLAFIGDTADE